MKMNPATEWVLQQQSVVDYKLLDLLRVKEAQKQAMLARVEYTKSLANLIHQMDEFERKYEKFADDISDRYLRLISLIETEEILSASMLFNSYALIEVEIMSLHDGRINNEKYFKVQNTIAAAVIDKKMYEAIEWKNTCEPGDVTKQQKDTKNAKEVNMNSESKNRFFEEEQATGTDCSSQTNLERFDDGFFEEVHAAEKSRSQKDLEKSENSLFDKEPQSDIKIKSFGLEALKRSQSNFSEKEQASDIKSYSPEDWDKSVDSFVVKKQASHIESYLNKDLDKLQGNFSEEEQASDIKSFSNEDLNKLEGSFSEKEQASDITNFSKKDFHEFQVSFSKKEQSSGIKCLSQENLDESGVRFSKSEQEVDIKNLNQEDLEKFGSFSEKEQAKKIMSSSQKCLKKYDNVTSIKNEYECSDTETRNEAVEKSNNNYFQEKEATNTKVSTQKDSQKCENDFPNQWQAVDIQNHIQQNPEKSEINLSDKFPEIEEISGHVNFEKDDMKTMENKKDMNRTNFKRKTGKRSKVFIFDCEDPESSPDEFKGFGRISGEDATEDLNSSRGFGSSRKGFNKNSNRGFGGKPSRGFGGSPRKGFGNNSSRGFNENLSTDVHNVISSRFSGLFSRNSDKGFGDNTNTDSNENFERCFKEKPSRGFDGTPSRGFNGDSDFSNASTPGFGKNLNKDCNENLTRRMGEDFEFSSANSSEGSWD